MNICSRCQDHISDDIGNLSPEASLCLMCYVRQSRIVEPAVQSQSRLAQHRKELGYCPRCGHECFKDEESGRVLPCARPDCVEVRRSKTIVMDEDPGTLETERIKREKKS